MDAKIFLKRVGLGLLAIVLLLAYCPNIASAAQITGRKVVIGSSVANASTTYSFTFTAPSATAVKSIGFAACVAASGACVTPAGFSSGSSTLASQSGIGTGVWSVNTSTAGELRVFNDGTNATGPSAGATVNFAAVHNPSAVNSTFFMRITTYSDVSWTTAIDTGTVAASTAGQITVTASVDETLTFTLANATVALGTLSASTTGTGTSSMIVATNAATGYSVSYSGTTLTSASNTIAAMAGGASLQGTPQFGINLMANTIPLVGSNVTTGTGAIGAPAAGYGTANSFKFVVTGDNIASATGPSNANTFTTSYIANIDDTTKPGAYSTVLTYVATANF